MDLRRSGLLRELTGKSELYLAGFGQDFDARFVGPFRSDGSLGEAVNSDAAFWCALRLGQSYFAEKYAGRYAQGKLLTTISSHNPIAFLACGTRNPRQWQWNSEPASWDRGPLVRFIFFARTIWNIVCLAIDSE